MKTLKIKTALLSFFVVVNLLGCITGFAAKPVAASKHEIRKGLVAYWPLDVLSATTPDLSGNKNHLQAINLTAADVVPGKRGNAISFNGINSILLCFTKNGVGLPAYSHNSCTVAMWVKGNTSNEMGRVFSESTNLRNPLVAISTDSRAPEGVMDVYLRADNGNTLISHHHTSLKAFEDVWHHIAWVDENGKARLYVDGIQDTSRINYKREPIIPTITALGGVMRFDTARFVFQGLIDEAAIWSRALTNAEIKLVMKKGLANFLPKTNGQSQNQTVVAKEQINSAHSSETVKDADGNIYHTVKIGNQVWTVEDLKTTRFNDGTSIPNVIEAEEWKKRTAPGYCYYENNPENGKKYGILYNWYAASSEKIAPKGWRVPTLDEQIVLSNFLIDNGYNFDETTKENKISKSMAAKTDWNYYPTNEGNESGPDVGTVSNNPETNNRTGLLALPAGSRWNDGSFHSIGQSVYWWSSTPGSGDDAHLSFIKSRLAGYGFVQHHKRSGFCIRLIRE
jgi:uncharacterized protein (TIGR02145 family)